MAGGFRTSSSTNTRIRTRFRPRSSGRCGSTCGRPAEEPATPANAFSLMVVGDDAQSIYSFREATVENILRFPGAVSRRQRTVTLEQNYRSVPAHPRRVQRRRWSTRRRRYFTKNLWSERRAIANRCWYLWDGVDNAGSWPTGSCSTAKKASPSPGRRCCSVPGTTRTPSRIELSRREHPVREMGRA